MPEYIIAGPHLSVKKGISETLNLALRYKGRWWVLLQSVYQGKITHFKAQDWRFFSEEVSLFKVKHIQGKGNGQYHRLTDQASEGGGHNGESEWYQCALYRVNSIGIKKALKMGKNANNRYRFDMNIYIHIGIVDFGIGKISWYLR